MEPRRIGLHPKWDGDCSHRPALEMSVRPERPTVESLRRLPLFNLRHERHTPVDQKLLSALPDPRSATASPNLQARAEGLAIGCCPRYFAGFRDVLQLRLLTDGANAVLRGPSFSNNLVPKPRTFLGRSIYVLGATGTVSALPNISSLHRFADRAMWLQCVQYGIGIGLVLRSWLSIVSTRSADIRCE
jgi:hypothetical protein